MFKDSIQFIPAKVRVLASNTSRFMHSKLGGVFAIFTMLALMGVGAHAQDPAPTLWSSAQTQVEGAATSLSGFLIAALVIPLAYFAWRMIKSAIRGA